MVAVAEQTSSLIKAADKLRPDAIELASAMRWVQRRVRSVHHVLRHVVGLLPEQFARCNADVAAFRKRLATKAALLTLRSLTAVWLPALPAPLGFATRDWRGESQIPPSTQPGACPTGAPSVAFLSSGSPDPQSRGGPP